MTTCQPCSNPRLQRSEKLADDIARLAAHLHAATYRFLVLIRKFDETGGWGDQGCLSCAHWLSWRCGISVHTGREQLRVARALANLPRVSAAFEAGRISYSKARAITRVADEATEEYLLGIALNGTASHLDKLVRLERRRREARDARQDARTAHEHRRVDWLDDYRGSVTITVRLPKEQAARVLKAIQACEDEQFRNDVPAGTPEGRPSYAQRRADALVALADEWLGGRREKKANVDNYQVLLHVPAGTSDEPARLDEHGVVAIDTARRLCCDAGIVPILENAAGETLDVGRKTRSIPPALRRALNHRDRNTCRFPGCSHSRYLHGHHIEHWADGGETKLDNLLLLCSHHHHLVHEGGFDCRNENGSAVFRTPAGAVIPDAATPLGLEDLGETPQDFEDSLAELRIDRSTCLPHYYGDRMNYDYALNALATARPPDR